MSTTLYEQVRARAEEMGLRPRDKSGGFGCDCPLIHRDRETHVWVYRMKNGGYRPTCKGGQAHSPEQLVEAFGVPCEGERPTTAGCTLDAYAELKKLPVPFLSELGLRTTPRKGESAVSIPHLGEFGMHESMIYRTRLSPRAMAWKQGDKAIPYGLWRLADARAAGHITIVEGQSDCHVLWYHHVPALGLAGAGGWNERVEEACEGVDAIYVVIEPGKAGADLLKKVAASRHRDRVHIVRLSVKDPADLHVLDPGKFPAAWAAALAGAPRIMAELDQERAARVAAARERCAALLRSPDIMVEFRGDAAKLIAGEEAGAQITYLAVTTRLFQRPVPLLERGPSSSGKSHVSGRVLRFFPETAYRSLTSMSARALVFSEESLCHRFLCVYEVAGLADETLLYIVKSLISEGRIEYDVTEKKPDGKLVTRTIVKPGPTGLILTTTRASIDSEMETRLLAISTDDSCGQTEAVMEHIAGLAVEDSEPDVDFSRWHALQTVLESIDARVVIPFALTLARKTKGVAVRLRRDFSTMISLVKAHALLHHATRARDGKGRIVATLHDYETVRLLVEEFIGEGVGASVPDTIKETVYAVKALTTGDGKPATCSVTEVGKQLGIDKSAASGRVNKALVAGYLENESAGKRGVAYKLKLGTPLPEGSNVFPTREELEATEGPVAPGTMPAEPTPGNGIQWDQPPQMEIILDGPCFVCRGTRFWIAPGGPPVCGRCHPPGAPYLVHWVEWRDILGEGEAADAH